jgi:glycosyltransferase involved in cell wall biosynthesis
MRDNNRKPTVMSFTHYGQLYGANRSLLTLIITLKDQINWWIICKEKSEFTDELIKHGIRFTVIPFTNDVYKIEKKFQLLHSIKRFCYNIPWAIYLAFLALKGKVNVIHSNSSVIFIGAMVSLISGKKHLWHIREFVFEDYGLKYLLGNKSFQFWANKAHKIICISNSIRERRVVQQNIKSDTIILYNGIVKEDQVSPPRSKPAGRIVIGIVGIIDPAKEQLTAIKAIHELKKANVPAELHVIGNVSSEVYFESLQQYVTNENISDVVKFKGFTKDITEIYKHLDISLMCAKNEALGRVTIESMMYGVPVVAFASSGTIEIVQAEKTGLLYSLDEKELASQIRRLAEDETLYNRLSIAGIEHVSKYFTVKSYRQTFLKEILAASN